jgi:hypothetical protein
VGASVYLYHKEELMLYAIIAVSVGGVLIFVAIILKVVDWYSGGAGKKKKKEE